MITALFLTVSLLQIPSLPSPAGPFHVGTRIEHFTDANRADPVEPAQKREIMVQYWYPTDQATGAPASYLASAGLLRALLEQGYYMQKAATLNAWKDIQTHAFQDAPISHKRKWPLLLFEPGVGMTRVNYTTYCEELASQGYFVAAIDPTRGGVTVLPDGKVLTGDPDLGDPARQDAKTAEWAGDFRYVLGQLLQQASKLSLDRTKVGVFGHSMGGAAALQAAMDDSHITAAVDMDGSGGVVGLNRGARVPMLFLKSNPNYSDADLAKLGRTRAQWEAMGKKGPKMFPPLTAGTTSKPVYQIAIRDTGHLSFSDAPFVMPDTITRFSDHSLPASRTLLIVMALTRGFFDHYLQSKLWAIETDKQSPYEEAVITRLY